jgi:antitoxin component YwqK of YwqJK toxin-antitoxin module
MGMRTGEWFAWDENGKKVRIALFDEGKLIKETQIDEPEETSPPNK